ncbi:MAG: hypothetical protein MJ033_07075 [Victivallaceae bacterium]|nr:hypothetical protein [Victivallaceae bacterium]
MTFVHYLSADWEATLAGRGGELLQLRYRRKNFQLLHTTHPVDREIQPQERRGVSFSLAPLEIKSTLFDLEEYADGFGARYHHAREKSFDFTFDVWLRYQFYPRTVRQSIFIQNFSKKTLPLELVLSPCFRLTENSATEITAGKNMEVAPRPSGFSGAVIHHPAKELHIAYTVDPAYSQWDIRRGGKFFCAGLQSDTPVAPVSNRTLTTVFSVS